MINFVRDTVSNHPTTIHPYTATSGLQALHSLVGASTLGSICTRYDLSAFIFSLDVRVFQAEYKKKAVEIVKSC